MYCILSKESISNFFTSEDQREYIDSKDFFAIQGLITKKNLYDKIAGWVNYYPLFERVPFYLAVMTDNYFFSHTQTIFQMKDYRLKNRKNMYYQKSKDYGMVLVIS